VLLVATELRISSLYGIAVCLLEAVEAGQPVWSFDARFDQTIPDAELASLTAIHQQFVRRHAAFDPEIRAWLLYGDLRRHFALSDHPNICAGSSVFDPETAAADLGVGTELTVRPR
jgi:hypothetical protein